MASISAEETFGLMRRVAEAAGWTVNADRSPDGSMHVKLLSTTPPVVEPVKPLQPEELAVSASAPRKTEAEVVLSVVFGTYQRFDVLKRAVESIRASAQGEAYEICVCDGGSTDGSREWLAEQPDVVLVGKRSLDGAVDAFNHAYAVCRGKYIANFNDDASYRDDALAKAVAFMDENQDVGQAIFAFRGAGEDYVINEIYPGNPGTEYANFGITRREAMEQVVAIQGGMWNSIYRTYAADCENSAWVHRLGWRVARLDHLRVVDVRTKDDLRVNNESRQGAETKLMYYRWPRESFRPDGPPPRVSPEELARFEAVKSRRVTSKPVPRTMAHVYAEVVGFPLPEEEDRLLRQGKAVRLLDPVEGQFPKRAEKLSEERVLYVSMATTADPQAGLDRALRKFGPVEEVKWYQEYGSDPVARKAAILAAAQKIKPSLCFMQLQTPNAVGVDTVREIREISPGCIVTTWSGDVADCNSPWSMGWQVALGRACDLTLHASFSHVHVLRSLGLHNAAYLQIGFDPGQYQPCIFVKCSKCGVETLKHAPCKQCLSSVHFHKDLEKEYDVCFLGSRYANDAFSNSLKWHDAYLRNDTVEAMQKLFGERFGLFGRGWGGKEKSVPLHEAHTVYQNSKIGLNVSLANYMESYSSDRLHRILGCGALLLTKRFPLMSTWGLRESINCLGWDTPGECVKAAKDILEQPEKLVEIANAGAILARDHLSWDVRMLELSTLVAAVRGENQ